MAPHTAMKFCMELEEIMVVSGLRKINEPQSILHCLWSADLSKSYSQLIEPWK